jgi:anti-anti-sigma factor
MNAILSRDPNPRQAPEGKLDPVLLGFPPNTCPICKKSVITQMLLEGGNVYQSRHCPVHGGFTALVSIARETQRGLDVPLRKSTPEQLSGHSNAYLLRLEGDISANEMAGINRAIGSLLSNTPCCLILDFRDVDHVHFTILSSLAQAKKRIESFGGDLLLTGLSEYVKNIFFAAGAIDDFRMFGSAERAAEHFAASACSQECAS